MLFHLTTDAPNNLTNAVYDEQVEIVWRMDPQAGTKLLPDKSKSSNDLFDGYKAAANTPDDPGPSSSSQSSGLLKVSPNS